MRRLLFIAALALFSAIYAESALAQNPYTGEIRLFGFNFCPAGWTSANGQILPIEQYQALFSLYGTSFGGNGVSTFALPNLNGRVPVGSGQDVPVGQTFAPVSTGNNPQFGGLALTWCVAVEGGVPQR
ncbi:MAG: tail fiber protein [Hyphomicrobiales bacterium]|nr:tail fiber protein [Hyphomicrobiales bacterium]MBV8825602.1 tail fiber protein [Hyphomicrobiales bacterium]MBV9427600.1 tail fiber protein [Bradyrhizobiaceae bacterium]